MHIENETLEIMTFGEQEYDEVIEEYEEEIIMQEDVPEPSVADFVDTPPAQSKPRCITLILKYIYIYMCVCVCVMCIYVTGIL